MTDYALNAMSDATLPPLQPSSSAGELSNTSEKPESNSQQDELSFISESQGSVTNGDLAAAEDRKSAEKKRKRTSPEDQAILEAEYKANPKPDKAARLEIVTKVSLGEKAVQIWFQNRRQNTRRKSRPLLPHEIAAFGLGGMAALSSDQTMNFGSSQGSAYFPSSSQSDHQGSQEYPESSAPYHTAAGAPNVKKDIYVPPLTTGAAVTPPHSYGKSQASSELRDENSTSFSQPASQPTPPQSSMAPGYLANRRSASSGYFGTPVTAQPTFFNTPTTSLPALPTSCPEKFSTPDNGTPSSSQIRLSMSLDGKASLVPTDFTSSPPRPQAIRPDSSHSGIVPKRRLGTLQRSQSALPYSNSPIARPNLSSLAKPGPPRMPISRPREVHSWEFSCDAVARDELTAQAENESSGSAIAAISLLRSSSNSALKVNMNKRNSPALGRTRDIDGEANSGKRVKLGRAQSSLARLQGTARLALDDGKARKRSEMGKSPGGDSDKENWIPADGGGHRRQNRAGDGTRRPKQGRRRILGDESMGGAEDNQKARSSGIFEDETATGPVDAEVEKFMRGEVSPSKKGDLDCIQGLLSLSQGNWR